MIFLGVAAVSSALSSTVPDERAVDSEADEDRYRAAQAAVEGGDLAGAVTLFQEALEEQPRNLSARLELAYALLGLDRAEEALRALSDDTPALRQIAYTSALRAQALHQLGRDGEAYRTLRAGIEKFQNEPLLIVDLVTLLAELGLHREARRWVATVRAHEALEVWHAVSLIAAFRRPPRDVLDALERLAARFPDEGEVTGSLAHAYASAGYPYVAAELFAEAVRLGANYAFEVADHYRLAKHTERALRWNARVSPPERRLAQRVVILFSARRMARVVALEAELNRLDAWDDPLRYRVAFAHYRLGDRARARELARSIDEPAFRESAKSLLEAIGR